MPDVDKRPPVKPVMPPATQPAQDELPKPKMPEPAAETTTKKPPKSSE